MDNTSLYEEGTFREITEEETSNIDHPSHYNREGAFECIDEMLMLFGLPETMVFCKLNAWKYRYRAADKNGEEDLKKSDWYLKKYNELLTILQNQKNNPA